MLNRHTKYALREHDRPAKQPGGRTVTRGAIPIPASTSYDLEPIFEFLRTLIEVRVVERLDQIFEHVRRLEALEGVKTDRRAIRLREVLSILGISKSTLYDRLNQASPYYDARMPKPFKLGSKNIERAPSVWWQADVIAYLESCAQSRYAN